MSTQNFIKNISLDSHIIQLFTQDQTPWVEYEGHSFNHIWLLNHHLPLLSDPHYLSEFAEISNFLWKGEQFQFINDIHSYQQFYMGQIEREKKCSTDIFQYRLTDYKIFDVSVMHEPLLKQEQLIYFVYNTSNGLPYRVTCPFPYLSTSTLVHYQILPIKSEAFSP